MEGKVQDKRGRPKGLAKTGGRKPGTPNRKTLFLKDALESHGFDWASAFVNAFKQLTPRDQIQALQLIIPFIAPKLAERDAVDPATEEENADTDQDTNTLLSLVNDGGDA